MKKYPRMMHKYLHSLRKDAKKEGPKSLPLFKRLIQRI